MNYGQCQDRARNLLMRNQADPTIGRDRALDAYAAEINACQRQDAQQRARDARVEQQRLDQQRLDDQRFEQQRLDQQRVEQQRLDQLRARQRDDMLRNRR
jgi:hypothetical protein